MANLESAQYTSEAPPTVGIVMPSVFPICTAFVFIFAAGPLLAQAQEDPVKTTLAAAKKKHSEVVAAAKLALIKAFDERIKEAASAADLPAVKELIADKEEFQAAGSVPAHPKLTEDVVRYVGGRRAAASELYKAYQGGIRSYTTELKIDKAIALETELRDFVSAEQNAILIGKVPSLTGHKPTVKLKGTKENFAAFYNDYGKMMETIADQPTTAKQEQTHRDLVRKLDEKIKPQTWEFNCEITDVKQERDGDFVLHIEEPSETPAFAEKWHARATVENLKLSRQQGLDLSPGDILVLRGTPRFAIDDYRNSNSAMFSCSVRVGDRNYTHELSLANFKFSIEKKKPAKDE
jgi:hypothetical protein